MHHDDHVLISSFVMIFSGAAVLATLALFTRQPLILAYIIIGVVLGPHGTGHISDPGLIQAFSEIGIIFLLFLLGLDMQLSRLLASLKQTTLVGFGSSLLFCGSGYLVGWAFGYGFIENLIIGLAMMFSSTIVGIKLLPTTVLHHRHTGELVVSLLLIQDLIAILVLLILGGGLLEAGENPMELVSVALALPCLIGGSVLAVRFVVMPTLQKFDAFHEFIFLAAIGWCLGIAEIANILGLSREIGAFIGGISIATSQITYYIATHLKPLRDFFLVLFFFSMGAGLAIDLLTQVMVGAVCLAIAMIVVKPLVFRLLLQLTGEEAGTGWEVGFRLGQTSEFSLLIALMAASTHLIGAKASLLIQATTIITFLASTYLVVFRYPSPIAVSDKLRRD